jgi:quercetin dioxygenase-like cupin family protein
VGGLKLNSEVWDLAQLADFSKIQRVKKDICKTKTFNIVLVCLETGQEIPPHPEPYDVCFYVIEGQGTFTTGDKQTDLKAGSMIFTPANSARGIKSTKRLRVIGIQEAH